MLDKLCTYGVRVYTAQCCTLYTICIYGDYIKSALNWFKSYLHNRMQIVIVSDSFSDSKYISIGVPQGLALGGVLSLIYMNDLTLVSNKLLQPCLQTTLVLPCLKNCTTYEMFTRKINDSHNNNREKHSRFFFT